MGVFRWRRKVRLHLKTGDVSIEGVMEKRTRHEYIIYAPKVISADDDVPEQKVSGHVEVPIENVLFYQVIG